MLFISAWSPLARPLEPLGDRNALECTGKGRVQKEYDDGDATAQNGLEKLKEAKHLSERIPISANSTKTSWSLAQDGLSFIIILCTAIGL